MHRVLKVSVDALNYAVTWAEVKGFNFQINI